jgi:two-component system response regulator
MGRALDLLIVDDDVDQLKLVQTLITELGLQHRCHYAVSGREALDFLNCKSPFEEAPRPDLILLDLNMPGMNGCEVLRQVKSDVKLRSIPVIMLSSSKVLQDVNACYKEHANAFVSKPGDLESTLKLLRNIHRFWSEIALLPELKTK